MDTDKYFDELNKKIDNMSDKEFEDLLYKFGFKYTKEELSDNIIHEENEL